MEPALPKMPAPFAVKRQIAYGASSTVFEAVNEESGENVALKVFHAQITGDAQFLDRLQREADALLQIRHPNVVRLIKPWAVPGQFFLELELIKGRTLMQWMRETPVDWLEPRIWLLIPIARALGAAHQEQILHRDLKPENILISESGEIKLTDFGLAKSQLFSHGLTQTGSLVGSLAYMAPEAIEGKRATVASDVFSFGAVAYEMLCGCHPFFDENAQLQVRDLLAGRFTPSCTRNPRVPHEIGELLDQCLNKDENLRPASIWRVEAALLEYLQKTRLLSPAKAAIETTGGDLAGALRMKHEQLKGDIDALIGQPSERRKVFADQ